MQAPSVILGGHSQGEERTVNLEAWIRWPRGRLTAKVTLVTQVRGAGRCPPGSNSQAGLPSGVALLTKGHHQSRISNRRALQSPWTA